MKFYLSFLFSLFILFACKKTDSENWKPSKYLNEEQQQQFKYDISRYLLKIAPKAKQETKFESQFDDYYKNASSKSDLLYYYPNAKDGYTYFVITKVAPSLQLKKDATAGRLKKDDKGNITEYEESFVTWKMEEPELKKKTEMLFGKYLKGEDLTKYETKNTNPEFYIEFPDDNTRYNKTDKKWD